MTNEQTSQAISLINALWPQKPLDAQAGALVGSMIAGYEFAAITGALRKLATTEEWFHVSKLLKALAGPTLNASEVYRKLRAAANIHGPRAGKMVAPGLNAIAKEAGDWPAIRNWKAEGEPFDTQRVAAAIQAVADIGQVDINKPDALALERPSAPALSPASGLSASLVKRVK